MKSGKPKRHHQPDALQRFGVSMEEDLLARFDRQLARKGYVTRSEALRDMVRATLEEEAAEDENAEAVGTISLVYNHHARNLTAKLTHVQHGALELISSNLHIHLDEDRCLEVLVVRGTYGQVRELAERLISIKGVKHGKFVTTVGVSNHQPAHLSGHTHPHPEVKKAKRTVARKKG
jgi:CopG family transcriptional regulator, nickel-responsive regulator